MTLDFIKEGSVVVSMHDYVQRPLNEAPEKFEVEEPSPAGVHLFNVDDSSDKLSEQHAIAFHHLVAKCVFLCKRSRPDLKLAVGFLTTRVKSPDFHDWKKLRRMIRYLRGSQELTLRLQADDTHMVKWWVDAAFEVHPDMRSQSGGAMSMGGGVLYGLSIRQKLNTRSSTEAKLAATDDFMPQILWTSYFLEAQGYEVKDNVIHQDNQSAILHLHGQTTGLRRLT